MLKIIILTILLIALLYLFVMLLLAIMNIPFGILFRYQSFWIGLHYSKHCKRYCLNIIPCCTLWWTINGHKPDLKLM